MVERNVANVDVVSSNLITRSKFKLNSRQKMESGYYVEIIAGKVIMFLLPVIEGAPLPKKVNEGCKGPFKLEEAVKVRQEMTYKKEK